MVITLIKPLHAIRLVALVARIGERVSVHWYVCTRQVQETRQMFAALWLLGPHEHTGKNGQRTSYHTIARSCTTCILFSIDMIDVAIYYTRDRCQQ